MTHIVRHYTYVKSTVILWDCGNNGIVYCGNNGIVCYLGEMDNKEDDHDEDADDSRGNGYM